MNQTAWKNSKTIFRLRIGNKAENCRKDIEHELFFILECFLQILFDAPLAACRRILEENARGIR